MRPTIDDLLGTAVFRREHVEAVLSPVLRSWVKYDPELGYVPTDIVMQDGIDNSFTQYSYETEGNRRQTNFRDRLCRINTYGDSYTQCQQVNDAETWQEYLAAHLGEPIRNYGVGGYGLLQAVRRAKRVEDSAAGAPYVVLNVFDDDHIRNLDAARWIRSAWRCREAPITRADQFHGLPWCHLRYDLQLGDFVELPGACPTPDDLRALCDPCCFRQTFQDDQIVRLNALQVGIAADFGDLEALARLFGLEADFRNLATAAPAARQLHLMYGIKASQHIIDGFSRYMSVREKQLLVLLSYGQRRLTEYLERGERFDTAFVDHLRLRGIPFVDGLEKHRADAASLRLPASDYLARYFIRAAGAAVFDHYSPAGNHFFAFAIKDDIVELLRPRPEPYRDRDE